MANNQAISNSWFQDHIRSLVWDLRGDKTTNILNDIYGSGDIL